MDEFLDETFPAIAAYIVHWDPTLREEFLDAAVGLRTLREVQYRQTGLSAEEMGGLDRIDRYFADAVTAGNQILEITGELNKKLETFERDLATIDAILDDQIQPLIYAETAGGAPVVGLRHPREYPL